MSKHLLITGANRGIGLALVRQYLADGWQVTACCRHPEEAVELTELLAKHESLDVFELDVTNYEALNDLANELSGKPIDLLINNAGYYGPKGVVFGLTDVTQWREVLEINTIAPFKITEAFYPHLKLAQGQNHHSVVAFLSSKVGSMADNSSGGGYLYRSSKAALNSVIKSLSIDLSQDNILTAALHPGWVQTDMGGSNALIDTETSAEGLRRVIDSLTPERSGHFFDYNGREIPW